ncbi:HAUS augmin-like complex subunit 2 [Platichthys flesus]|uniref:HAUS augmin-like complex subunit 2 n=1 Tax=Platichthys flesus TaxID=8260 RepID=UPI002DB9C2EA|nr:HAUS augmin-like complex subunit 2 [Platichthys flesus]
MHQWDLSLFSVTPAASLLSRCVSRGAVCQEEIDSVSSKRSPAFSSHLQEAEQRIRAVKQLDELHLEAELLQVVKESADVTHSRFLAGRFQMLQMLSDHLQQLLKELNSLRQRLTTPPGHTHLPVHAHLHRYVLEVVKMSLDFMESLEEKLDSVHSCSSTTDRLSQLSISLAQLLAQTADLQNLSNQVPQWRDVHL